MGAFVEDEDVTEANTLDEAGSAYIFFRNQGGANNWGLQQKIAAPNRAASDWFGYSVAISGDYAIVGASGEDEDATEANTLDEAGSVYVAARISFSTATPDHASGLMAWPNPAHNLLTVETTTPGPVTVRDLTGKMLMTAAASGATTLDISELPAGMYLLQTEGNGAKMFVKE